MHDLVLHSVKEDDDPMLLLDALMSSLQGKEDLLLVFDAIMSLLQLSRRILGCKEMYWHTL